MTRDETIEKVARAICETQCLIWQEEPCFLVDEYGNKSDCACESWHWTATCLTLAKAAVAAMEEADND